MNMPTVLRLHEMQDDQMRQAQLAANDEDEEEEEARQRRLGHAIRATTLLQSASTARAAHRAR